jgi:trehalose 6-phosphate phosphatase
MAAEPSHAAVTGRNLELLEALTRRAPVAVASGRDLPDLRRMLPVPGLILVGLHGLAWQIDGDEILLPEAEPFCVPTVGAAEQLVHLSEIDGVIVEVKTVGLAFHYRGASDHDAARAAILAAIVAAPAAAAFQVHEGIRVVELRPPVVSNKGMAVRRLTERLALRGLIFLGDDITDIDGFLEARRLRHSDEAVAYGIAVLHPEAPSSAAEAADFAVPDIEGVECLLGEIVGELAVVRGGSEVGADVPPENG